MDLSISKIQPVNNATEIINVIHSAFKRYESDAMPSSALAETATTIEENINRDGIEIIGAYVNNQLVGVVKISEQPTNLYFSRLSVLPSHQKRGIASKLIAYVEGIAAQRHLSFVQCKVRKSEQDNIRLYEKLGYYIISEENTTSPTGFLIETVTMEKRLT